MCSYMTEGKPEKLFHGDRGLRALIERIGRPHGDGDIHGGDGMVLELSGLQLFSGRSAYSRSRY